MRYTPDNITELKPNEVFVFGSNLRGAHGGGAATLARLKFGAEPGVGEGPTGQAYAFPTKDKNIQTLSLGEINISVLNLLGCALDNPDKTYLVTKVGCGLAGYGVEDIAPLFKQVVNVPNIILPKEFHDVLDKLKD